MTTNFDKETPNIRKPLKDLQKMGIVRFDVELDNPTKTYLPGSVLSGKVYLDLDAPKPAKSVKLTISGKGKISWDRTRFALEMKDIYAAEHVEEIFIDEEIYLLSSDSADMIIPEGRHVYPFSRKLPETIPSSYKDRFGKIEYSVDVSIRRVWYLWNHRVSEDFKVLGSFDLNSDHKAAESVRQDTSETFMGCSKPVDVAVWLPVRGYIPSQKIPVTVDIRNGAKVNVKGINFSLIKVNSYHGKVKTRREELVLGEHETPIRESFDVESRNQHFMKIPPCEPSYLKHCKLIDIEYLIRIEIRVGGLHSNIVIDVPVIIGSVALLATNVAMSQGALPRKNDDSNSRNN